MNKREEIIRRKQELQKDVLEAKQELFVEVDKTKKTSLKLTERTALIGGSLIMGFLFVKGLRNRRHVPEVAGKRKGELALVRHPIRNRMYSRFLQYLSVFLLGLARKKLIGFLIGNRNEKIGNTEQSVPEQK